MARSGSYAHPEPISVALGMEHSDWSHLSNMPAPGVWSRQESAGESEQRKNILPRKVRVLLAGGGMITGQAKVQTLLCDVEKSEREGSGETEPPLHPPLPPRALLRPHSLSWSDLTRASAASHAGPCGSKWSRLESTKDKGFRL